MLGDVIESRPVPIALVKALLSAVKEKNHEQKITFEYASKFAKVSREDAEKLMEELRGAGIPRLKDKHIVKLVDIMPESVDELRAIFLKEDIALSKEDMQKILEILSKYR